MKKLIIVKPGTLKSKDKTKLTKDGNIVIEHPDPHTGIAIKDLPEKESPITHNDVYNYTTCYTCGERVYMLSAKLAALRISGHGFYCVNGHSSAFTKPK